VGKDISYVRSAIEDLAFTSRSSMKYGLVGPEDCLSTGLSNGKCWEKLGLKEKKKDKWAQFRRAKKGDEGMALKIRTRAEDISDGFETHRKLCPHKRREKHFLILLSYLHIIKDLGAWQFSLPILYFT